MSVASSSSSHTSKSILEVDEPLTDGERTERSEYSSSSGGTTSGSSSSSSSYSLTSSSSSSISKISAEMSLLSDVIEEKPLLARSIFWENMKAPSLGPKKTVDPTLIDNAIDNLISVLNDILIPLEDVACQVTYLEPCKAVRAKIEILRDATDVLGTCDYRSMDTKDQKLILTDLRQIHSTSGVSLKHFVERLVMQNSLAVGSRKKRGRLPLQQGSVKEPEQKVMALFDEHLGALDIAHRTINAMVDATVSSAMTCRLGFNEINMKRRLKKVPTAAKQMYEAAYNGGRAAITALKTWDWTEARRIVALTAHSDNLLDFYGYALHDDIYYLAYEFADHGTLAYLLRSRNAALHRDTVMDMLSQILGGLTYLHESGFRMGSLTTRTLLVCGVSYDGSQHSQDHSENAGSASERLQVKLQLRTVTEKEDTRIVDNPDEILDVRWRRKAPEVMEKNEEYATSDIYAAGVLCWEALSGAREEPWSGLCGDSDICEAICSGECLPRPEGCPQLLYNGILLPMWRLNPSLRPSAIELDSKMDQLYYLTRVHGNDLIKYDC